MVELTGSLAWKIFTASVPILVSRFYFQDKATDQFAADRELQENYTLPLNETFDFIIVGGGTAGCILARRLSEEYSVLLLEAGGEPPPVTRISNLKSHTTGLANVNWYPKYTKQDDASLENGGLLPALYAAKMLGGSFSHNNAHYERGSPYDYDNWANWTGDASWNYTSILKYFLKLENYKGHFTSNNGQHGYNGLIDLVASKMPFREDLFFSAGRELGYDVSIDPNGPQRVGFSPAEYNTHKGLRVSTYTAYLKPIMGKRDNLVVRKYSVVSKVLFKNNNRVEGVHYYRHGVPRVAFASKEVILSAGTFNSPMILIQSGIGPKDQLEPFKIQQLADLPVGLNYQTHSELQLSISVKDKSVFRLTSDKVTFEDLQEFKINGTGFLGCREALQEAFIVSTRAIIDGQSNWPDIQLFFRQNYRHGKDVLTCSVHQTRPRSIGRLLVNTSADTLEDVLTPILDFKFFSDETDFDVLIDGIRVCQKMVKTPTFQEIGAELLDTNLPACSHLEPDSRAYWKCVIRQKSTGLFHATGTVRMGASADKSSVLDSSLRVRDVEGLRVVDQSVFPFITNANTNAAVMLVAEKASEEILLAWKLLRKVIH